MSPFNRRQFVQQIGVAATALSYIPGAPAQTPASHIRVLPIEFGPEKVVFCDWWFIEAGYGLTTNSGPGHEHRVGPRFMPRGVKLRVARPMLSEQPIIIADRPTDGVVTGGYSTLMKDGGKFRLWYESYLPGQTADAEVKICYAESDDGFHWKKPDVGIFEYQGSKANNMVYSNGHGASIFIDPTAPAAERYKMIHLDKVPLQVVNGKQMTAFLFGAVSPDGIHWTRLKDPVIKHTSDTQSVAEYDPVLRKYVAYLRGWEPQTRAGYGGRRIVVRTESPEFGNFPEPVPVLELGPQDPPDADVYTNAYQRWPGASHAHLMTPAIYHHSSDHVDLQFAVSRDGLRWQFPQREPFLRDGEPGSGYEGAAYAGRGTIAIGKGMWAFPVARYHETHNAKFEPRDGYSHKGSLWLAMLPEDGYIVLDAEDEGECWTQPATFSGSQMLINSRREYGGEVQIEISDERGTAISGYSLADCDPVSGAGPWSTVSWRGNSNLTDLRGKMVRLRFHLIRARLHAFRFA